MPEKALFTTQTARSIPKSGLKPVIACLLATFSVGAIAADSTSSNTTVVTVGSTTTQLNESPLLVQIQEKINSDSNEIDVMALRIKEMIRARHNADAINIQSIATIEELRRQLASLEKERDNGLKRAELLLSSKDDLQKKLDALWDKHNSDREQIASLEGAARQSGSALGALEQQMQDARDSLQEKQLELAQLEQSLGDLTAQHDGSQREIDGLNAKLAMANTDGVKLMTERNKLADALDTMENRAGDVSASLGNEQSAHASTKDELSSAQSAHALTQSELADVQNQLANSQNQLADLERSRDALAKEKAMLMASTGNLNEKLGFLQSELDNRVTEIQAAGSEYTNLSDKLNQKNSEIMQANGNLADANGRIRKLNNQIALLTKDRDLANKDVKRLTDHIDKLNSEFARTSKNNNANAKAAQATLQAEIDLQAKAIEDLNSQLSLANNEFGDATAAQKALNGKHQKLNADHLALGRKNGALAKELDDLKRQFDSLSSERDKLALLQNNLTNELSGLADKSSSQSSELDNLATIRDQLTAQRNKFAQERDSLAQSLKDLQSQTRALASKSDTQQSENNSLVAKLKKLQSERDSLSMALKKEKTDNDSLSAALAKQKSNNKSLVNNVNALAAERDSIIAKANKLAGNGNKLAKSNQERSDAILALQNKIAALESDAAEKNKAMQVSQEQNDELMSQLKAKYAALEKQLKTSNSELQALLQDNDRIENERLRLIADAEALRKNLEDELAAAELNFVTVQKAREDSSIPLRLGTADFFATGSAQLTEQGQENLQKLTDIITKFDDRRIVVAGHTDSKKIGQRLKSKFFSNWELSVARAAAAVRFIQDKSDIEATSLSAAGYSEYAPIADNASPEGRQKNRRVEVVLYPKVVKERLYSELDE